MPKLKYSLAQMQNKLEQVVNRIEASPRVPNNARLYPILLFVRNIESIDLEVEGGRGICITAQDIELFVGGDSLTIDENGAINTNIKQEE